MIRMIPEAGLLKAVATAVFALTLAGCGGSSGSDSSSLAGAASATTGGTSTTDSVLFSASTYAVAQGQTAVVLTVNRPDATSDAVSVAFATADGTAVAGTDYTAASGTLQWAADDSAAKTISVNISSAVAFSGNKVFDVSLASPSGGAVLGSPHSASVTISGSASATVGTLQLADPTYSVAQTAKSVTISVNRTGGAIGTTTVAYATANGTAVAGTDYTAAQGTLQWTDGDSAAKTFKVSLISEAAFSGSKAFSVTLSNATAGAMIGTPASATVTITGSTSTVTSAPGGAFWVYYNGVYNWGGDYSFQATANYKDSAGVPLTGSYDIAVKVTSSYGGFLPFAGGTVPLWNFDASPYTKLTFALKAPSANFQMYFVKVGDVALPQNCWITDLSTEAGVGSFTPNQWSTFTIPLSRFCVGAGLTGGTSIYKFAIQDQSGQTGTFYLDNIGFE